MDSKLELGFAYNDPKFSDKTLLLVVCSDEENPCSSLNTNKSKGGEGCSKEFEQILIHVSSHNCRKRLLDGNIKADYCKEYNLRCCEGHEDSNISSEGEPVHDENDDIKIEERLIHVSSAILAARSPFFRKDLDLTFRVNVEKLPFSPTCCFTEETAVKDLLKFMYTGTLSGSTPSYLLDVAMVAEKFEVASCIKLCKTLLLSLPVTVDSALFYLGISSNNLIPDDIISPLSDAAKKFLAQHFNDISMFEEELLELPLAGFEAVLSTDNLKVISETQVYNLILKWVQAHFPDKSEEKRITLNTLVRTFVRFPFLQSQTLKDIITNYDFDRETVSEVALATCHCGHIPSSENAGFSGKFKKRAYKRLPVRALVFDDSHPHTVVYLDVTREECQSMFPRSHLRTETFYLGKYIFCLRVNSGQKPNGDRSNSSFGFFLSTQWNLSTPATTDLSIRCKVTPRTKPSNDFEKECKSTLLTVGIDDGDSVYGWWGIFRMPWAEFVAEDSPYFTDGILRLRVDLSITR